jgi:hypothetical protein
MDGKELLDAMAEQSRRQTFKETEQITLGELIARLEGVDGSKPVVFDGGEFQPSHLGSWRGSYHELAIRYEESEGDESMSAGDMAYLCNEANGSEFRGYKGGDFEMDSTTPVWVANRGTSSGFIETEGFAYQGVVNVEETDERVSIVTDAVDF